MSEVILESWDGTATPVHALTEAEAAAALEADAFAAALARTAEFKGKAGQALLIPGADGAHLQDADTTQNRSGGDKGSDNPTLERRPALYTHRPVHRCLRSPAEPLTIPVETPLVIERTPAVVNPPRLRGKLAERHLRMTHPRLPNWCKAEQCKMKVNRPRVYLPRYRA